MIEAVKEWKNLIPGEECWPGYILLHKALLRNGSGITIWRSKALGYYTVELWSKRGDDGLPAWGGGKSMITIRVMRNWNRAENKYKSLIEEHGGL